MSKFTDGKWSWSHRKNSEGLYNTDVYDDRGQTICTLDWHTDRDSTATDREDNARLISCAPDMYAMVASLARELHMAIDEVNLYRMKEVTSQTENQPDMWDMQSLHEAQLLLKAARGE